MDRSTRPPRMSDAAVERAVARGFRRMVGRGATPAELELLRPLWQVAGYDEGDVIWGVVFTFARQFEAIEKTVRETSDLTNRTIDVINRAAGELPASIDAASEQARDDLRFTAGEVFRRHRLPRFLLGVAVGASLMLAGAVYFHYPEHEVMVHLMEGIDSGLAARMMSAPDTVRVVGSADEAQYLHLEVSSCDFSINDRSGTCRHVLGVEWEPKLPGGSD